jgi:hypothetical protein
LLVSASRMHLPLRSSLVFRALGLSSSSFARLGYMVTTFYDRFQGYNLALPSSILSTPSCLTKTQSLPSLLGFQMRSACFDLQHGSDALPAENLSSRNASVLASNLGLHLEQEPVRRVNVLIEMHRMVKRGNHG